MFFPLRFVRKCLTLFPTKKGLTMADSTGLREYRLNSVAEPTDEQLQALMEKVGEEARRQSANAKAALGRMMQETREKILAIRRDQAVGVK